MRHLTAVLEDCEHRGIRLESVNGDGLEVRTRARGSLTPELREELSYHKPNILRVVRVGQCIHERKPEKCNVCNGYVRRLIEQGASEEVGTP